MADLGAIGRAQGTAIDTVIDRMLTIAGWVGVVSLTGNAYVATAAIPVRKLPIWEIDWQGICKPDSTGIPPKNVLELGIVALLHSALVGAPLAGTLSGTVKNAGAIVPYARVGIYYRPTMMLIGQTRSVADGTWSYGPLRAAAQDYFAVALPPSTLSGVNGAIFDNLTAG